MHLNFMQKMFYDDDFNNVSLGWHLTSIICCSAQCQLVCSKCSADVHWEKSDNLSPSIMQNCLDTLTLQIHYKD